MEFLLSSTFLQDFPLSLSTVGSQYRTLERSPTALSITIIGFIESIAIVKSLAAKHKYEVDASTELIGLGVANFVGAMFQAFPVTGSFGRSAVNDQSGAQSGVSGMVTALLVGMVLLFLTDVFEYMVSWFSCWFLCGFVSDLVHLRLPAFVSPLRHCHSWCT